MIKPTATPDKQEELDKAIESIAKGEDKKKDAAKNEAIKLKKENEELKAQHKALLRQLKAMQDAQKNSVYATLSKIDVKPYLEQKNRLNYLSWSKAWGLVKAIYPDANYKITEYPEYLQTKEGYVPTGRTVDYRVTPAGIEVEATVTVEGESYSSKLYVMDFKNRAVKQATYFEINKTQLRALVKALAFAGLGLNVYAGEDLPSDKDGVMPQQKQAPQPQQQQPNINSLVMYAGKPTPLAEIWEEAKKGSTVAAQWWHIKAKENSKEGNQARLFMEQQKR